MNRRVQIESRVGADGVLTLRVPLGPEGRRVKWMLDTNACIRYLNGRSVPLKRHIEQTGAGNVVFAPS